MMLKSIDHTGDVFPFNNVDSVFWPNFYFNIIKEKIDDNTMLFHLVEPFLPLGELLVVYSILWFIFHLYWFNKPNV